MNIGFDAKRAYHNGTGLGHYSRTLISALSEHYPEHQYFLFNPKPSGKYFLPERSNLHEVAPRSFLAKKFSSLWRSNWVKADLKKMKIDLYHGLSHEIPFGMQKTGMPSVVTIHDLIHERYPEQYNFFDVKIYNTKFRYACNRADKIIAISQQTKQDIIQFYNIQEDKIEVCYQSCNPAFGYLVNEEEKKSVRGKYDLPEEYFLYVGSVVERKNFLNICKAVNLLKDELSIPLVVIGNGGSYKKRVKEYIVRNNIEEKIIFLSDNEVAKTSSSFKSSKDFPAIYQSAIAMIYPSIFEGFGIPVLEALWSRLPVITSNLSSLPEAGGDAAYYIDPAKPEEIAVAMKNIYSDAELQNSMKEKGWQHAQKFTAQKSAGSVIKVYESLTGISPAFP